MDSKLEAYKSVNFKLCVAKFFKNCNKPHTKVCRCTKKFGTHWSKSLNSNRFKIQLYKSKNQIQTQIFASMKVGNEVGAFQ